MHEEIAEAKKISKKQKKHIKDFYAGFWKTYVDRKLREYTLTSFEKDKFLTYVKWSIDSRNLTVFGSGGAITFRVLENFYGVDITQFISATEYEVNQNKTYDEVLTNLNIVISDIKLPKYKDLVKDKVNWLGEIFELTALQKELIIYFYLTTNNKCIEDFSLNDSVNAFNSFCGMVREYYRFCDIKIASNELTSKGFLNSEVEGKLVDYYSNLIADETLNTKSKFIKHLTGTVQKPSLKIKDFEHIKQINLMTQLLKKTLKTKKKGVNILLYGASGTGKTECSKVLANNANLNCYAVATDNQDKEIKREERLADLNTKQAILGRMDNACLLFDEAEDVFNRGFGENGTASKGYLNRLLENNNVPVIWTTNDVYSVDPAFLRRMSLSIEFPTLTIEQRLKIWQNVVRRNKLKVSKKKLEELSESYDIPPALINNAVETTKLIDGNENTFNEVVESVASVMYQKKDVKTHKDFDVSNYNISLINTDVNIEDLIKKIKACGKLNFSMCMFGMPGTSKSSLARYIADSLNIPVVVKKASDLLSMWVGEGEKMISAAFNEACDKGAMLIIDEADSFLQNRNNAIRSWEISMTNQFLCESEHFDYPFVCTTNLMDTIDDGMLRRFTFKLNFKPMEKQHVKLAFKHFFNLDTDFYTKGLTAGDFVNVLKQTSFLGIKDETEIVKMLQTEVKLKKDKSLQNTVGF